MTDTTFKNANILIVDDTEANIDILAGLLELQGYTNIKSTTDSRQALSLFHSFKPDLILLDIMMPHFTGYEVMEQLKSAIPAETYLPVLVLTADITVEAKQTALSGGANDFLNKPFDLVEVGLRIRNLLFARYLFLQSQNQNQLLEEKVKERTLALELTNQELIVANEKSEASNRLKTSFMNNISHEVRTPLNGILGYGSLLAEPDLEPEDRLEYLSMMKVSSNRLMNTISDYMDISLIASGNMEVHNKPVNLTKILVELKNKFQPHCDAKKLRFNMQFPDNYQEIILNTDPSMLRKIISHLIDNAIKFTAQGSVTMGYTIKPDNIELFVSDTGVGVEKEAEELIFKSFMQENSSNTRGYEGSGLGLSIISGFLMLMGGKIHFNSVKSEGSTFYISLPVEPGLYEELKTNKASFTKPESGKPVILIAEDELLNMLYMETILKSTAAVIIKAANGFEAVELCRTHPEISVVIMDLKMPGMNGFDATKEIKSFRKDVLIIAVTAFAMNEDKKNALEAGCDEYLAKPASKSDIIGILKEYGFAG